MAGLWVPNGDNNLGAGFLLNYDLRISLFKNNYTPVKSSVFSDFTLAYEQGGVTPLRATLSKLLWSVSVTGTLAQYTYPTLSWPYITGADTIYGWFLDDGSGNLSAAERFPGGPYTPGGNPNTLYFDLALTVN